MKNLLVVVFLYFGSSLLAAEADLQVETNIHAGNVRVSGNFRFDESSRGNSVSTTDLNLGVGYFAWDRIALGLTGELYHSGETAALVGPSVDFFFWQDGKLATDLAVSHVFGLTERNTVQGQLSASLGLNYFATPSVAFGPYLAFNRVFSRRGADYSRYGFGANFGIFL